MFDALDNFRDFGGYRTRDGRAVVRGRLFRSAHHANVTEADLHRLHDLGIAVFVDLRRTPERELQPCRRPATFQGLIIENDLGGEEPDRWLEFLTHQDELTPESFRNHMRDFYRDGAYHPRHIDLFARYFDALAQTDGAVLIHCAAGKDRTGILAGLTHHLAGVDEADLIHDYLLTNDGPALRRRAPAIARNISEKTGRDISEEVMLAGLLVEPDYLTLSFGEMARRNGSVDAYLQDVLGVDAAKRQAIIDRIVA